MIFRAYHLLIEADFDLRLPHANGTPDIVIKAGVIAKSATYQTNIYRKAIRAKFCNDDLGAILDWPDIARFLAIDGQQLIYQRYTTDDDVFRLFVLSEALGLLLFQRGVFLLHGSAVKIGHKAIVFLGQPGAGKSTTAAAFAKAGFTILSDDMTAIAFDSEQKAVVWPGFPEIKIWQNTVQHLGFDTRLLEPAFEGHHKFLLRQDESTFPTKPLPLQQIFIVKGPHSKKTGFIKNIEAPLELLRHFPLPVRMLQSQNLQKHFKDCLQIAASAPIAAIKRPKNFEALGAFVKQFIAVTV
jgi:hypothetical protein